ncbi:MAG: phosphatase PAP2 family protein, partial [Actinobacteria bacterium]
MIALDRWALLVLNGMLGVGSSGAVFVVVSHLGDWAAVWLAICAAVLWVGRGDERSHRTIVLTLAALLASEAAVAALKVAVARPRPAEVIPQLQALRIVADGFSFPSAHAARSFAAAGVLASHL